MYCIEESGYDIVTFWPPAVIRGDCAPLPPLFTPGDVQKNLKMYRKETNFQVRTQWTSIP